MVHGSQVSADHVGWKLEPRGLTADPRAWPSQSGSRSTRTPPSPRSSQSTATACGSKSASGTAGAFCASADTPRGVDENFASPEEIVGTFETLAVHACRGRAICQTDPSNPYGFAEPSGCAKHRATRVEWPLEHDNVLSGAERWRDSGDQGMRTLVALDF